MQCSWGQKHEAVITQPKFEFKSTLLNDSVAEEALSDGHDPHEALQDTVVGPLEKGHRGSVLRGVEGHRRRIEVSHGEVGLLPGEGLRPEADDGRGAKQAPGEGEAALVVEQVDDGHVEPLVF